MRRDPKRILVLGAGSVQGNATINCFLMGAREGEEVIGAGCDPVDLMFARSVRRYEIPHPSTPGYKGSLLHLIDREKPDMLHFQHDLEVWTAMQFRPEIEGRGVQMLIPNLDTIDACVHKARTWELFRRAGLTVPNTIQLDAPADVRRALDVLGDSEGRVWLRSGSIGNGGKGALATNNYEEATNWIDRHNGWGQFLAAEMLKGQTVTWLSIWRDGQLVVGQGRLRHSWAYSAMSVSGVTGITRVCETVSDENVSRVAVAAIQAVDDHPNGIYGVDMMYDDSGTPNPTEINVSRFFTTIQFFAEAGLNMPQILKNLVLYNEQPNLPCVNDPLPPGLLWLRSLDATPILTSREEMDRSIIRLPDDIDAEFV